MKDVLVTGAAGGMGRAVTDLLTKNGYRVFALDRERCPESTAVISLTADLTDGDAVASAFRAVSEETDGLFAIVHLAGIYTLDSLVEISPEKFDRAFRVNLGGAFLVNRTFLPLLKEGSRIITVTSELAVRDPLPFTGIYGITKTALDKYCYSLRMELQLLGIPVSVLRAGAVDTGMLGDSTRQLDSFCENTTHYSFGAKRFRQIVDRVEARRVPPEKIAKKINRIMNKKDPAFSYSINRNPLLILLDKLPERARFFIIRKILRTTPEGR
ncbi:MAG: SDR family oxidoreductase [Clostridia bacterium]|nr:SDR family oxidoreductase [Clostridia bacterium]